MAKHLSFWIGFFAAALLIVPVAVGVWGAAGDLAEYVAVFLFGAITALVGLLVLMLFFRDRILPRILRRSEATLEEVTRALVSTVSEASSGNRLAAEANAQKLGETFAGWYAWSSLYRWVVGSALGLLLAFAAFTGTVLLFEQNRKLGEQTATLGAQTKMLTRQTSALETQTERFTEQTGFMRNQTELMQAQTERLSEQTEAAKIQNEIMTLTLVQELRAQLEGSTRDVNLAERVLIDSEGFQKSNTVLESFDEGCTLAFSDDHVLQELQNISTLEAIKDLTENESLSNRIINSLQHLARDRNGSVAIAALKILSDIDQLNAAAGEVFSFENVYVDSFELDEEITLNFSGSYIYDLECAHCSVNIQDSIVIGMRADRVLGYNTIWMGIQARGSRSGVEAYYPNTFVPENRTELGLLHLYGTDFQSYLTGRSSSQPCDSLRDLAVSNPIVQFSR